MPIFMPIVAELGIDPVWFLVMMAVNLNIAFISPPVGFSLFYLQSVKPAEVSTDGHPPRRAAVRGPADASRWSS